MPSPPFSIVWFCVICKNPTLFMLKQLSRGRELSKKVKNSCHQSLSFTMLVSQSRLTSAIVARSIPDNCYQVLRSSTYTGDFLTRIRTRLFKNLRYQFVQIEHFSSILFNLPFSLIVKLFFCQLALELLFDITRQLFSANFREPKCFYFLPKQCKIFLDTLIINWESKY